MGTKISVSVLPSASAPNHPLAVIPALTHPRKTCAPLLSPASHPAACALTPRQLCSMVRWVNSWKLQPGISTKTSAACKHLLNFSQCLLICEKLFATWPSWQATESVCPALICWSAVLGFWTGGGWSASDCQFLPNLIQIKQRIGLAWVNAPDLYASLLELCWQACKVCKVRGK